MGARKFLSDVENGVIPVNSHNQVLRIAWIYLDEPLWNGQGVFDVIEKLRTHGWSFGEGDLRFNRLVNCYPFKNTILTLTNTAPWICST